MAPSFLKWLFTFVAFIIKAVYGEIMTILPDLQKISRKNCKDFSILLILVWKKCFIYLVNTQTEDFRLLYIVVINQPPSPSVGKGGCSMKAVTYLRQFLSLKSLSLIIGGSLVYSIGFNMFILPCNLYNGGFLGIAQLLGYFMRNILGLSFVTDSYIGIIYFLLNIPLMLLAIRKFGKDFLVKSAVCITSYSVLLSLVPVAEYNYLPDTITACLAGGILCGLGCGMTLMSKGSGGGEGILGLLLMHRYHNMSVGKVFNIINIFVFGSCILLYDVAAAVYSIFFAVITSVVLDKAYLPSITVTMIVITKIDLVEEVIFAAVHRGVTKIKGIGAYSGEDTNVLLTVVSKVESMKLRHLLEECDPNIFIIEYENVSVIGNFEKRL